MTPLLRQLKQKFTARSSCLKYIKISNKWVSPCNCQTSQKKYIKVHAYCLTARIVMNQYIFCDKCCQQYNLYIKEEAICSNKLLQLITKYIGVLSLMILFAGVFITCDALLKLSHA